MIVAVLETNVLVSGFPRRGTVPATLIDAWRQGAYDLAISEHILEELAEAWQDSYWRSRFSPEQSAAAIRRLRSAAIMTPLIVDVRGVAAHSEDDLILAASFWSDWHRRRAKGRT